MKIAEVSVNLKKLPSKEDLIQMSLKSTKYYRLPVKVATKLIEKEIKDSGLFKTSTKRVSRSKKSTSEADNGRYNNKQSKSNKTSKE